MPGCVEAHESNNSNKNLLKDDKNGIITYCDAGLPSFNPPNFEPRQVIPTKPADFDTKFKDEKKEKEDIIDAASDASQVKTIKCRPDEKINLELNRCEKILEEQKEPEREIPWHEQYLPEPSAVTTTASIALVATTSALMAKPLADLLLKTIKPTIKKIVKKVQKILKKEPKVQSVRERRDSQRDRNQAILALKKSLKK
jgi:hypothetical protein